MPLPASSVPLDVRKPTPVPHRVAPRPPACCSKEELRQLFTLRTDTACDTHDLLAQAAAAAERQAGRGGSGSAAGGEEGGAAAAAAPEFRDVSGSCEDGPLCAAISAGHVTFVHLDRSQELAAAAAAAGTQQQEQQQQQDAEASVEEEELQGPGCSGAECSGAAVGAGADVAAAEADGVDSLEVEMEEESGW